MPSFPLITHRSPDRPIAWRDGGAISAARFLADVARVRQALPAGAHMLNACADRYRFMVGLAAALCAGKINLLPSTRTPEMIGRMLGFAPDAFCLTDSDDCRIALPQVRMPALDAAAPAPEGEFRVPAVDSAQTAAYVFTSGSTGAPVPHRKTWGLLVRNVQAGAHLYGLADGRPHALVGTVPPQHMYGFETTVLIVMQSGNALVAGNSFYPADICAALASAPRPRALVSTPVHLRSVLQAGLALPPADLVLSATAPLSGALAREAETGFAAPLLEIYGCTETGQLALRRTAAAREWQLFPGVALRQEGELTVASGGHIEQPTAMNDVIECTAPDRFLLHGRHADLVNIAGKRSSLAYLDLQLNAVPGVLDGTFFMPPEEADSGVTRLAAFVVAPGLGMEQLLAALRERIDPAFLPRPLVALDALPRNATGKLPREALLELARTHLRPAAPREKT